MCIYCTISIYDYRIPDNEAFLISMILYVKKRAGLQSLFVGYYP